MQLNPAAEREGNAQGPILAAVAVGVPLDSRTAAVRTMVAPVVGNRAQMA
jgi:hypothetical protein